MKKGCGKMIYILILLAKIVEVSLMTIRIGFSLGNYFGSRLEEKIGLGLSEIKVIVKEHHGNNLVDKLRNDGYAVTVTKAEGKTTPRQILSLFVKRKNVKTVVNIITNSQKNAVITTTDIKPIYGGYGIRK